MNIKIENNKIQVADISAFTNRTIYSVPKSRDSITFIFNDSVKQTVIVNETTVNGTQMTPDNIDELLADLFFLEVDINDISGLNDALVEKADLVNGFVPSYQLPSYVDDVIEGKLVNDTDFDVEGFIIVAEKGKIYVDINSNKTYRWSGSLYTEISKSATKETLGLDKVDNTSDLDKPVSTAQQTAIKQAVDAMQIGGVNYILESKQLIKEASSSVYNYAKLNLSDTLQSNTQYTLSVAKSEILSGSTVPNYSVIIYNLATNKSGLVFTLPISGKRQSYTFNTGNLSDNGYTLLLYTGLSGSAQNRSMKWEKIQLEKGNKATSWDSSPIDFQNRLTSLDSRIKNIPLGGVNLISNLTVNWEQGTLNSGASKGSSFNSIKTPSVNRIRTKSLIDVSSTCAISWINTDTNISYKVFYMLFDEKENYLGISSEEWNTSKFIIPDDVSKIAIAVSTSDNLALTTKTFNFLKIMLERGNKYSTWTPSLEDIQTRLLAIENNIRNDYSINYTRNFLSWGDDGTITTLINNNEITMRLSGAKDGAKDSNIISRVGDCLISINVKTIQATSIYIGTRATTVLSTSHPAYLEKTDNGTAYFNLPAKFDDRIILYVNYKSIISANWFVGIRYQSGGSEINLSYPQLLKAVPNNKWMPAPEDL